MEYIMKLMNILRNNKLNETDTRATRFIWGEIGRAANNVSGYQKEYDTRMKNIKTAMAKHFPGISENDILVYTANTPQEADRINAASKKAGQLGIWADKTTFIFRG